MVDDSSDFSTYTPSGTVDADLGKYLSRPVIIHTIDWEEGASINTDSLLPWKEYFNHPSIKRKIDNYAYFRCNLHLKFVINASPFYYSCLLCSYRPILRFDPGATNSAADERVPFSQRPHVYLYPQNCEGGEMVLPCLWYREWMDFSDDTLSRIGRVAFNSMDILRNANSIAGTGCTVQVFAWATDIELAGNTVALAVQSSDVKKEVPTSKASKSAKPSGSQMARGSKNTTQQKSGSSNHAADEYSEGFISKPASAVARAMGMLSVVPYVGEFAVATGFVAEAVANVASLFGYSNPPVLDEVKPYKSVPFHAFASSDISVPTEKLTIDPKNELTLDHSFTGSHCEDELLISNFVQKESFLTDFTWLGSDAPDSLLWNVSVTPDLANVVSGTGQQLINPTPMWLTSQCFDYWRGDIIFRFNFLKTVYHKGRVKINWDPYGDLGNTTDSITEVFTRIVDLSIEDNVEIRVPYTQWTAYLQVVPGPFEYFSTSPLSNTPGVFNGLLTVRVMTELTSPVASSQVQCLVSVRGAENLEFATPKEMDDAIQFFSVQSQDVSIVQEANMGVEGATTDPKINLAYMGEHITSFRQLFRRTNYAYSKAFTALPSGDLVKYTYTIPRRPLYKGYDPDGFHTANETVGAGTANYNFSKLTPHLLISSCFVGERGSYRWKFNADAQALPKHFSVDRSSSVLAQSSYDGTSESFTPNSGAISRAFTDLGTNAGMSLVNTETQTGLEVEAPMYNNVTMMTTAPVDRTLGEAEDNSTIDTIQITVTETPQIDIILSQFYCVGTDYSCVFFLNCPTLYYYTTPTSA